MGAEALVRSLNVGRPTARMVLEDLQQRRPHVALGFARGEPAPTDVLQLPGCVLELSALPGAGALTCGLMVLREARARALSAGESRHLCLVDPTRTLCAPAVAALGVPLEDLLVLQPPADRLLRVAVRAQKSKAFSGVLVDASAVADLSHADVAVRRLALACEESGAVCVLVTSSKARRGLSLPTGARALVEQVDGALHVRFLKHKHGTPKPVRIPLGRIPLGRVA